MRRRGSGLLLLSALLAAACAGGGGEADLDLHRADNAVAQGRHDWARIYYRRDFERHPQRLSSLRSEAVAWVSGYQRSLNSAADAFRQYLEQRPDDDEARRLLARSLLLVGEFEQVRALEGELDDSPEADLLRAELFLETDLDGARQAVERALAADPENPRAHALAAQVYDAAGETELAARHAAEATRRDPLDYQSHYLLGRALLRSGEREAGRRELQLHQLTSALMDEGARSPLSDEERLENLSQIKAQVEPSYAMLRQEAQLLFSTGRLGAAGELAENLLEAPEASVGDLLQLGVWADAAGRRELSRRIFQRVLERAPDNPGALSSLALLRLRAGDADGARKLLAEGLAADPYFARYHHLLGRVATSQDRLEEAIAHERRALELAPWEAAWRLDLADLLRATGDAAAVRQLLDEAPEEHPSLEAYRQRHAAFLAQSN